MEGGLGNNQNEHYLKCELSIKTKKSNVFLNYDQPKSNIQKSTK